MLEYLWGYGVCKYESFYIYSKVNCGATFKPDRTLSELEAEVSLIINESWDFYVLSNFKHLCWDLASLLLKFLVYYGVARPFKILGKP